MSYRDYKVSIGGTFAAQGDVRFLSNVFNIAERTFEHWTIGRGPQYISVEKLPDQWLLDDEVLSSDEVCNRLGITFQKMKKRAANNAYCSRRRYVQKKGKPFRFRVEPESLPPQEIQRMLLNAQHQEQLNAKLRRKIRKATCIS